jgi:hypothetical protein
LCSYNKCLYKKYYAILLTDNYTDNLDFLWREISALGFVFFYIKERYFYINGAIYVRTYRYLIIKIITIKLLCRGTSFTLIIVSGHILLHLCLFAYPRTEKVWLEDVSPVRDLNSPAPVS